MVEGADHRDLHWLRCRLQDRADLDPNPMPWLASVPFFSLLLLAATRGAWPTTCSSPADLELISYSSAHVAEITGPADRRTAWHRSGSGSSA